jgi:hypothetical protein
LLFQPSRKRAPDKVSKELHLSSLRNKDNTVVVVNKNCRPVYASRNRRKQPGKFSPGLSSSPDDRLFRHHPKDYIIALNRSASRFSAGLVNFQPLRIHQSSGRCRLCLVFNKTMTAAAENMRFRVIVRSFNAS